jgi:molybdopterin adenylyltransferase
VKLLVLTVSDRAYKKVYEDFSGPIVEEVIRGAFGKIDIDRLVVPDCKNKITEAFNKYRDCDVILTTGGTGISPRDVTPETTQEYCEKEIPGIVEILRYESFKETPHAMLSRAYAGIKGKTVLINLPGSTKGARFCSELLIPVLKHIPDMIKGKGH